jgi:3-hydroxyisobutyrate dehydrogenase-like beta-hydroxyacid dehydrogenase
MAKNIARHIGSVLNVFDTRQHVCARAAEWGAKPCRSAKEVAASSDVVLTMLPNDEAVRAVIGDDGGVVEAARNGLTVIDFSTIAPATMKAIAGQLAAKGARAFGGTVTLGVQAAIDGKLAVYLDDEAAADAALATIVRGCSAHIMPTAGLASSKVIKLVNNLMVAVNVAATAEAVALSEKAGLSADVLVPLILKGSGNSYALANHIAQAALKGDVGEGKFGVDYILKDLELAMDLARSSNHSSLFGALSMSAYRGTKALGYGANYYPIVLEWMERASGQESPKRRQEIQERIAS